MSVDSWTPGPKPLCHRHPTGPHPSGLLWTPWTPAKGASTKSKSALAAHLRPRMGGAIDRAQAGGVDVGVALGGREAGVAQQLLDGAQVAAGRQQVGRKGVPERMRLHRFGEAKLA